MNRVFRWIWITNPTSKHFQLKVSDRQNYIINFVLVFLGPSISFLNWIKIQTFELKSSEQIVAICKSANSIENPRKKHYHRKFDADAYVKQGWNGYRDYQTDLTLNVTISMVVRL